MDPILVDDSSVWESPQIYPIKVSDGDYLLTKSISEHVKASLWVFLRVWKAVEASGYFWAG